MGQHTAGSCAALRKNGESLSDLFQDILKKQVAKKLCVCMFGKKEEIPRRSKEQMKMVNYSKNGLERLGMGVRPFSITLHMV